MPASQSVDQSADQWAGQSASQIVNQSFSRSISQSACQLASQPVIQRAIQPARQLISQPANQPLERPAYLWLWHTHLVNIKQRWSLRPPMSGRDKRRQSLLSWMVSTRLRYSLYGTRTLIVANNIRFSIQKKIFINISLHKSTCIPISLRGRTVELWYCNPDVMISRQNFDIMNELKIP